MGNTTFASQKWGIRFCGELIKGKSGLVYLPDRAQAETYLDKSGLDKKFAEVVGVNTKSPLNAELHVLPSGKVKPQYNPERMQNNKAQRTLRARHERMRKGYTAIMLDDGFKAQLKTVFAKDIEDAKYQAELKYSDLVLSAVIDMQIPPKRIHLV